MKQLFIIPFLALASFLTAQHTVQFGVKVAEVTDTEKVYNFIIEDFINIVGWQFYMHFDGTKMSFKEIRNPILPDLSSSSFNEPNPGELISVWLDFDQVPNNFPNDTVAFQIVFDIIEDEGTDLCFNSNQEFFEFVVDDEMGNFYLSELIIFDECNQGFSIFFETTATDDDQVVEEIIADVYLNSTGTLAFTSNTGSPIQFAILGLDGRKVQHLGKVAVTEGRQSLQIKPLAPGIYLLQSVSEEGVIQTISVVVL